MTIRPLIVHCAAVAFALSVTAAAVHAQHKYPAKPIRVVVPLPPAGSTDIVARIVAQKLSVAFELNNADPYSIVTVPRRAERCETPWA